jgi:hypothetical protein
MFHGYIDESGDEKTNLRTLSCLAGHWSQLFWFQNDWEKILKKKNEELKAQGRQAVSRFHATYWSTKNGEFEGWSDEEKIEFIDKFIALFYRYPVVGSSETLSKQDLVQVFPEAQEQDRVEQLAHAFLLMFIVMYFDSTLLSDKRYATDRIAFIHDETLYKGVLRDTFKGMQNDIGVKNRDRLVSIEFKGWKEEVLLQAADLLAYENFKVIERQKVGADMRKPMKRILLSSKFAGRNEQLTKAALQEFRDNADKPTLDLVFKYARIKPA